MIYGSALGQGALGDMRLGDVDVELQVVGPALFSLPGIDGDTAGQVVRDQGGFVAAGRAGDAAAAVRSVP